jgi:hypothetical protein
LSRNARIALVGALFVAAIVGFVIASSGGDDSSKTTSTAASTTSTGTKKPAKPAIPTIVVRNEAPVGGIKDITVSQGDPVRFVVRSDSAQEIHVHGYDFHKDVAANGSVKFDFPAKIDGVFEIELEEPGVQIAKLRVNP